MISEEIIPLDEEFLAEVEKGDRWKYTLKPVMNATLNVNLVKKPSPEVFDRCFDL